MKKTGLVEDFTEHEESKCLRSCFRSQIDLMNENQARFLKETNDFEAKLQQMKLKTLY